MKRNLLFSFLFSFAISKACGNPLFGNVRINDPCELDADCVGIEGVSSHCIDRDGGLKCTCKNSYGPKADLSDCLATELFKRCETDEHCSNLGPGAYCGGSSKECLCDNTISVPKFDASACIPIAMEIDQPCEQDNQCQAGTPGQHSKCIGPPENPDQDRKCTCNPNTITYSNRCLPIAGHGEACEIDRQCTEGMENTACYSGGCECNVNYVINQAKTQCLHVVSLIGGACVESVQCKAGLGELSECSSGTCNCTGDGIEIPTNPAKCVKRAEEIGEACEHSRQCSVTFGEFSECAEMICICKDGAVYDSQEKVCFKKAELIGDDCQRDIECTANLGEFAKCSDAGKCACIEGYEESPEKDKCLPKDDGNCDICLNMKIVFEQPININIALHL